MAVDIIITLTVTGADQGTLFDLYSNVDSFNIPYEENVTLLSLSGGYTTSAPDDTEIVRVCGQELKCTNCVDITPIYTTTTTTTSEPTTTTTSTTTEAPGLCRFIFVPDTFDTTNFGVNYLSPTTGDTYTLFSSLLATVTNYNGQDGSMYNVCSIIVPQYWYQPTNTILGFPVEIEVLPSGDPCVINGDCTYVEPTTTTTTTTI